MSLLTEKCPHSPSSIKVIRCIKYPAVPSSRQKLDDFGHGCGEHTDYGWLTFVNQDLDSRNCLHVRSSDTSKASYISADPIVIQEQIALTCNIGDILAFFTENKYRSTRHCVINPVEPARSRISTPFFFEPNIDVKIQVNHSSPKRDYGEYLISKVRSNFNYYSNDNSQA